MVWTLLDVIDHCLDEPWAALLATHLDGTLEPHRTGRRYSTANSLTGLFRSYGANRPEMVRQRAGGHDTDGFGDAIAADLAWQPELWRELRARINYPSPAERLPDIRQKLLQQPDLLDMPTRISVFGPTRLTTDQIMLFAAVAEHRDVHVWLNHPSPTMWDALTHLAPPERRSADTSALAVTHPLLASLGRDVRELQQRLPTDRLDVHHPGQPEPGSVLSRIQNDIRHDIAPDSHDRVDHDATIEIHACHGPARQVEVLRESLLHLFTDIPTLEPREIVIMCPDIDTYAPLIQAALGHVTSAPAGHPGHGLRVRLADRGVSATNPLLDLCARLLRLADSRISISEVLDLAATQPVARRFRFTHDNLDLLRRWTTDSGARWALGQRQRDLYGITTIRQNTITAGLDRILLGVAAEESRLEWLSTVLPLDDVDSNDAALAGRFAEFLDRLTAIVPRLHGTHPATLWVERLSWAVDLLAEVSNLDPWQRSQAGRELAAAVEYSGDVVVTLADVRAMLASRLAPRPTRSNFRTGELTVCGLIAMRSVPHRVVVLLGLDDDAFPRGAHFDGDDVMARNPSLGERDPRTEDRQLLLDAVMATGDRLLIFYTGADPITGASRPPCSPLSDLIDVVKMTASETAPIVTHHPLQPFAAANFADTSPFGFDANAFAGAQAAQEPPAPAPAFLSAPLPALAADVDLDDLIAFIVHPTQGFLRQRLGLTIQQTDDAADESIPITLHGLQKWEIGERMLTARLRGFSAAAFAQAELRRGTLPPGRLGQDVIAEIGPGVEAIAAAAGPLYGNAATTIDIDVDLGTGRRLSGTVTNVHETSLVSIAYSSLAPRHRLAAWVKLVALAAARPRGQWRAVTVGKGAFSRPAWQSTLSSPPDPLITLRQLVDLRDRGLREPLPLATTASAVYADRRNSGGSIEDAHAAAAESWSAEFGESSDANMIYIYGPPAPFNQLWSPQPAEDERVWVAEPQRFGVLAHRLWAPVLRSESLGAP